jgi:hypothetical protein
VQHHNQRRVCRSTGVIAMQPVHLCGGTCSWQLVAILAVAGGGGGCKARNQHAPSYNCWATAGQGGGPALWCPRGDAAVKAPSMVPAQVLVGPHTSGIGATCMPVGWAGVGGHAPWAGVPRWGTQRAFASHCGPMARDSYISKGPLQGPAGRTCRHTCVKALSLGGGGCRAQPLLGQGTPTYLTPCHGRASVSGDEAHLRG